uniref:Uncharacterized protein n=1 Tax=Zea mays TaxID=4577 RepID=B6TKF0_MAIZE|nr:hypothetical protein [Zea mays]
MARLLTQTLTLARPAASSSPTAAFASLRCLATKVEIVEIDLTEEDAGSSAHGSSPSSPSIEVVGIRRLEEAIHGVMVRRAAPDWLPFVPGGSYWVPPLRLPHEVTAFVGRIAASGGASGVAKFMDGVAAPGGAGAVGGAFEVVELDDDEFMEEEEEALCFSTTRGWPSTSFFVQGKSPDTRRKSRKGAIQTDDEES